MSKLPTTIKTAREDRGTTGLRLPGMMRESPTRQLKTNLGKVVTSDKKPVATHAKGTLSQHTAPQKHQMGLIDPTKIQFGFGGPGSTDPV